MPIQIERGMVQTQGKSVKNRCLQRIPRIGCEFKGLNYKKNHY